MNGADGSRPPSDLAWDVLDTLPTNIAVLDPEGVVEFATSGRRIEPGVDGLRPPSGEAGEDYLAACEAADGEAAAAAATAIREVLASDRTSFSLEYPRHAPTERRWLSMRVVALERGGERRAVVTHDDITDRKLAELDAERKAETLETERETLALLNRIVRHDIRNDLNVILGWCSVLSDHVSGPGREHLDRIRAYAEGVVDLTETLGDLTEALEADEERPLEPVAVGPVLREEVDKVISSHQWRAEAVTVTGPDEYPDVSVRADGLLPSVFSNLLANAILHNDEEHPEIEVSVSTDHDTVVVRIADNGPGLPEDLREDVFERGRKGIESPGTGIGLYLVRTLVERYGGTVDLYDRDPKGTIAEVRLRRAD